jgi:hypothetical protein
MAGLDKVPRKRFVNRFLANGGGPRHRPQSPFSFSKEASKRSKKNPLCTKGDLSDSSRYRLIVLNEFGRP